MESTAGLCKTFDKLRDWLVEEAMPTWSNYGVDLKNGGFYERLDLDYSPITEPRRARLIARQVYFFSVGESLGWEGPADQLIDHGVKALMRHFISSDGRVIASCAADGTEIDSRQHLYDVSFVLLALAKVFQRRPDLSEVEELAHHITSSLIPHPMGGFIDEISPERQCANPHMHLFEAFLAWASLNESVDGFWCDQASSLAYLAAEHMIDNKSGFLIEHFNQDWQPVKIAGDHRIEPGHQFEWSSLLGSWACISNDSYYKEAAKNLCYLAEQYGVDSRRNVAIDCIGERLLPLDTTARLWQQTERLKAWHNQGVSCGFASSTITNCNRARDSVFSFLAHPQRGLWFDHMAPSGEFVLQPVKASSGYHITSCVDFMYNSLKSLGPCYEL